MSLIWAGKIHGPGVYRTWKTLLVFSGLFEDFHSVYHPVYGQFDYSVHAGARLLDYGLSVLQKFLNGGALRGAENDGGR